MKLIDLIKTIKEETLSKEQLEDYYADVSTLLAELHLELGEREKERALFIDASPEKTNAAKESKWAVTESGLREIILKRYIKASETLRGGIKERIYSML